MRKGQTKLNPELDKRIKFFKDKQPNRSATRNKKEKEMCRMSKVEEIFKKGKIPIVVGGSGLYLQALMDGFFEEKIGNKEIRQELESELEKFGKEHMHDKLKKVDPESADRMAPHYFRRVLRALEVFYASGKKISDLQKKNLKADFAAIQFGIQMERGHLYERINKRVDLMLESGLIKEIELLRDKGYHYKTHNSLNTVGIKEVFNYFEGEYSIDEMVHYIKQNSRRFAKRQLTWFRKDERINWIPGSNKLNVIVDEIIKKYYYKKFRRRAPRSAGFARLF